MKNAPDVFRVALVDDDVVSLKKFFREDKEFSASGKKFSIEFFSNPSDFISKLRLKTLTVDVVLMDINFENSATEELERIEPQPVPKAWAGLAITYMIKNRIDASLPVIALTDRIAADGSVEMPDEIRRRENIASKADGYYSKNNFLKMLRKDSETSLDDLADCILETWRKVKSKG